MVLRVGIVLAIFLAMCQLCAASFTETVYTATLTGAQVVPNAGNSTNFGTAIFTFNRHSSDLSIDVEVQHNIQGIISAAIWKGKRGVVPTQNALYNFTVPFSSNFRQLFILEDIGSYLVGDQITDFLYGKWFIQIYSVQFPNGAVRGQIEHRDRAYVRLDAINTIPQSTGTTAQGIALATFTFNNPKSQLAFDIVHGVVDPTGVDLYVGAENEIGTYFYELDQSTSPVFSNVKLTENEKTAFFEDLTYMNIKSKRNPSGDVRGQIITIDYVPDVAFTARLAGTSMVPNTNSQAKGAILVTYNCETYTLEYIMVHNAVRATRVVFGVGSPTQVGSAVYVADFNAFSPVYGSFKLTPQQEVRLYTKEMFVVLQSEFYPTGELRGQLTNQNDYYAYLSGTNVIPPVTGPGVGIATFRLQGSNQDELNYEILFQGVPDVIDVTLRRAPDGVNGPVLQLFDSRTSPLSGAGLVLKSSDRSAFVSEGVYVSISNTDHPFGEIRGQIRRLNPCTERNQVDVPSDITTYALFSSDIFQYDSPLTFSQLDSYSKQASSPGSFLFPSFSSLVYSSNPNNGQGQSTYQQSYGRSIDGAVPIDSVGQNKNQSPASSKNSNSSASHLLASASLLLVSLIAAFLL